MIHVHLHPDPRIHNLSHTHTQKHLKRDSLLTLFGYAWIHLDTLHDYRVIWLACRVTHHGEKIQYNKMHGAPWT